MFLPGTLASLRFYGTIGIMRYYLASHCALKRLEMPCVYDIGRDELYELDELAFSYLQQAGGASGAPAPEDAEFLSSCLEDGILVAAPVNAIRPVPVASPNPSLRYLELQITNRCNLRCRHCYVGSPDRAELSIDELKMVLDEFQALQGLRLLITGGEPLLHTHFAAFNAMLPDYAFRKVLFTNGQSLANDTLRSLQVDEIQVSVDGLRQGHDVLRGPGTFKKAIETLDRIHRAGIPVSVATMVHRENLDEFEGMHEMFVRMGVLDWTVDIPSPSGFLLDHPELLVAPEIAGRYLSFGFGGGLHGGGEGYACGLHLASVQSTGTVSKCAFYADKPAGMIHGGLASAWANIRPIPLTGLACADAGCSVLDECRGGCRFRAACAAPNGMSPKEQEGAPDLYKCFSYGIIETETGYEDRS